MARGDAGTSTLGCAAFELASTDARAASIDVGATLRLVERGKSARVDDANGGVATTRCFDCVAETTRGDVVSFVATARGRFASGVAAFGREFGRVEVLATRRDEDTGDARCGDAGEQDTEKEVKLVCSFEVCVPGTSGRIPGGIPKAERVAVLSHLSSRNRRADEDSEHGSWMDAEAGFCGVIGCTVHVGDRKATLSAALDELRPEMRRRHEPIKPATPGYACAGDLPEDVVVRILGFLDAKCACALAATCRGFRSRVDETSPELALTLHPHQRAALGWMRRRERATLASVPDPLWKRIDCKEGHTLWFNTLKGELSDAHPEVYQDSQGGMLCDEPGLGKTVTALALVLARRGWRPSPPLGHTARKMGEFWYYEESNSSGEMGYASAVPVLQSDASATTPSKAVVLNGSVAPRSSSRGGSSGLRRSKRSAGNTPVGYFAAVCKNGLYGTSDSAAKRSKLEEKQAYEALAAATVENPDWRARLECPSNAAPIGFIARSGLREDSARLARNTSHFEMVLRNCVTYVGRAATCDVVDYILENTIEVSHAMPLSMPPFRRNSDQPPLFEALGLVKYSGMGKMENAVPYGPPGPAVEDLILDRQALHDAIRVVDNRATDSEPTRVWLSSATLIIIPSVLIEHWLQQIAFCTGEALHSLPRVAVLDRAPKPDGDESELELLEISKKIRPTYLHDLSDVESKELANNFDVVIMPINRLSTEFSKMDTPILRVMWQRVILDEGHQLGASLSLTAKLSVACALKAHSRWLMTGTPTPTTLKGAGTAHLQPLLGFLRQPPYGTSASLWTTAVQRPLEGRNRTAQAEAVVRLGDVLKRCMVRTCKSHISLPPLKRATTLLGFSDVHAESYNDLVSHVKRSLLLADWGDPNHDESLMNSKNVREATAAVNNLREAACVVGKMPTTFDADEFDETIRDLHTMLRERGFGEEERKSRVRRVSPMLMQCKGTCDLCLHETVLPLVTPCAHLLCCACVLKGRRKGEKLEANKDTHDGEPRPELPPGVSPSPRGCPVCGLSYKMQAATKRADNPCPAQEVPQDLIELQPSYIQHAWKVTEGNALVKQGESSKVDHLLEVLRKIGAAADEELVRVQNERDAFFAREAAGVSEQTPGWNGEITLTVPQRETTNGRRRNRIVAQAPVKPRDHNPTAPPPKKCIVYSNFRTHLNAIDLALTGARVPFENFARLHQSRHDKEEALKRFKKDPDVAVLLLDRAAAEGLDLSFVTYVFLMEPLSNMSLEEQVVSRAHRMGQIDTVHVEVFAMRGTAEETLLDVQTELLSNPKPKDESVDDDGNEVDVAPTMAAESLSRRRVLERLALVSSKRSDEAAAKKAQQVREHFERLKKSDEKSGGGRVLGSSYKKYEEEEAQWMQDAIQASKMEMDVKTEKEEEEEEEEVAAIEAVNGENQQLSGYWILRVRDPTDHGAVKDLTLPNGGATTVEEMRSRITARIASTLDDFVVMCGFPPRALTERDASTPISLLGIRENDLINVRDALATEMRQADAPEALPTQNTTTTIGLPSSRSQAPSRAGAAAPKKQRVVDINVLNARVTKRLSRVLKDAETSTAMMLQDPDAEEGAMNSGQNTAGAMSIDLLRAAEGVSGGKYANDPTVRSLQDAFKAIIDERAKENEGNAKVSAALSGACSFSNLPDGRLVVKYSAPDVAAGKVSATERSDCVQDIPPAMLPFILAVVAADKSTARENLAPAAMAVASPRVFWAVVRHGSVGPDGRDFASALRFLAPSIDIDWSSVALRHRAPNPKYKDFTPH